MIRQNLRMIAWVVISVVLSAGLFTVIGLAQENNHKYVINISGKQRMLSQRMTKEILLIALGYNVRENLRNLESNLQDFDSVLKGLRYGDANLALAPIESPEVLDRLSKVEDLWPQFATPVREVVSKGVVSPETIRNVTELSLPLLNAMHETVQAYENFSNKGGLFSMVGRAVNLAGRQRMLTQKMTKEYLMIVYGQNADVSRKKLGETSMLFEETLDALINGDGTLKLLPPPNDQIRAQLMKVKRLWSEFKPMIQQAVRGQKIAPEQLADVASLNLTLLNEMNEAVNMYETL